MPKAGQSQLSAHTSFNIEPFSPNTNWFRWVQRLEGAFKLFNISVDQYASFLLHYMGVIAFDIICDKCTPDNPYDKTYEELKRILQEFYAPKPLEIAENYRFYQRNQEDGESLQDYAAALQKLTINCNFGNYLNAALRNKFVFGLQSNRIKCRLLEMDNLTFDIAVKTAISMELSEKDAKQPNEDNLMWKYFFTNYWIKINLCDVIEFRKKSCNRINLKKYDLLFKKISWALLDNEDNVKKNQN
jgi:hypothetical protein